MCSSCPEIKLEPVLGTSEDKIEHLSSYGHEKNESVFKLEKMKNARARRAKMLFFIVKYANLWRFFCRRRRGCLSSLIR